MLPNESGKGRRVESIHEGDRSADPKGEEDLVDPGPQGERHRHQVRHRRLAGGIGAGAVGGVLMTKGNDIRLEPGTVLRIKFERPVSIPAFENER